MLALLVLVRDLVISVLISVTGIGDLPEDGQKPDTNAAVSGPEWFNH
ncbi:MAG: hypothetical protein AAFR41_09865 [Pseudomonadota bacterium]